MVKQLTPVQARAKSTRPRKMLLNYNPHLKSDEEYAAPPPSIKKRKRKDDPKPSQESIKPVPTRDQKIKTSSTPAKVAVKPEPKKPKHKCVLGCDKEMDEESSDLRHHYSIHYFKEVFSSLPPIIDNLDVEDKVKLQECFNKLMDQRKYHCTQENCTIRKMRYRELATHLMVVHHQIGPMMKNDPRKEMQGVHVLIYPEEVKKDPARSIMEPEMDSEHVDDPTSSLPARPFAKQEDNIKNKMKTPLSNKVHNCKLCSNKTGTNLALQDMKYHYSECYYTQGILKDIIDPGPDNKKKGRVVDEFGKRFKYKCPFPTCPKNKGKVNEMGYKEYAIHCGSAHHMVERAMERDSNDMGELIAVLVALRTIEDMDEEVKMMPVMVEEVHACLLCNGKKVQELSFAPEHLHKTRYHYAVCFYQEGVYFKMYHPGKDNIREDGKPKEELGTEVKYKCDEKGCNLSKKMLGYKEYCIHSSTEHGGLLVVLQKDEREEVRALYDRFSTLNKD